MKSKVQQSPEESIPPLWRNRFCWLPIGGALITLIPTQLVIRNLWQGFPPLKLPEIGNLEEIPFFVADLDARTFYLLSLLLLAVSAIVAIILAGYVIFRFLKETAKKPRLFWAALLLSAIAISVSVQTNNYYEPIFDVIERTIAKEEEEKGYFKSDSTADGRTERAIEEAKEEKGDFNQMFLARTQLTADVVNKLIAMGILMVAAAFGASLHTPKNAGSVSVEAVASQRKKLLLALYPGTALLIFGVVSTFAAVRIPSVFVSDDPVQFKNMREVAMLITTTFGVTFTLSLAGAYIPASLLISERARSLAARFGKSQPDFDKQKWLEEQNLATSPVQHLTRGVAVLAPFLVSLSQLVANLF